MGIGNRLWHGAIVAGLAAMAAATAQAQQPAPVENVSSFPPRSPEEQRKALHVPPGFEIQLVASDPDIQKPLNLAFDDRGRLWVTDTVEYPYPAAEGAVPRDTVKILSDFGPDGKARSILTFADGLNIPIGLLPLPSARAALVHSIPHILRMEDFDGDGRADSREVLYGVFGHRDTHGMTNAFTWGFDGWIYACHGFANDSRVQGSDGRPISMNSGNTYRMRPDGSHVESWTFGQVNPFGLAFDPLGNLYSSDCHSRPVYQLLRGAWYPSFGKPHDGLGFGPEMVSHDHGSTGIAGIAYYAAEQFPVEYRGSIFVGNVVTNRVNRDTVVWEGSSPRGVEAPDFIWSEDNWFRPVDIELGPDGALYIADFYNRIIGHYEVPLEHPGRDRKRGRIWRVVYRGPDGRIPPPPGTIDRTASSVSDLIGDLANPNLAVRLSASNQLVERGGEATVAELRKLLDEAGPTRPRVHALWVLHRLGELEEQRLLQAFSSPAADRELRVHAMKIFRERPEISETARSAVIAALGSDDPFVARAAAEALGGHPDADTNLKPLLALRRSVPARDTHLIHVVRMALRDQVRLDDAWQVRDRQELDEWDRRNLADVATGVPSQPAAAFLMGHLKGTEETSENLRRYVHHIARHGSPQTTDELLRFVLAAGDRPPGHRLALLRLIQQGFQERGEPLGDPLRREARKLIDALLASRKAEDLGVAVEAAREFRLAEVLPQLVELARTATLPEARRAEALAAIVAIDPETSLKFVQAQLDDGTLPLGLRETAAIALANLDRREAIDALLEILPRTPERLQATIAAALARRRDGAEALLAAIEAGKASPRVLQERRVVIGLENAGLVDVPSRVSSLLKELPPADQKIRELLERRREGFDHAQRDPVLGAAVFEKHCVACHELGGKGARIGPQLDGIGSRGVDRLMEDILDPNRNIDQSFRVTNLALQNGQIVTGLLLREEGEVLVLADAEGKEVRLAKANVEDRSTAQISPMPANLVEQIAEPDFYNLIEYLLQQRMTPPTQQ